jgi:hypothetical protein
MGDGIRIAVVVVVVAGLRLFGIGILDQPAARVVLPGALVAVGVFFVGLVTGEA